MEMILFLFKTFVPSWLSKILGAIFLFFGSIFIFGLVYVNTSQKFLFQLFFGPLFIYFGWELLKL